MADSLTPEARSRLMAKIHCKDTKVEMVVRRMVRSLGIGYRLHRGDLPGCPDLVFIGRKKILFVHGCFWHRHEGCPANRIPKTNTGFWTDKLERNRLRDIRNQAILRDAGWDVLVVWECETRNKTALLEKLAKFLGVIQ